MRSDMAMAMTRRRQFLRVRVSLCLRGFGQLRWRNNMGILMRMDIIIRMAIYPAGINPYSVMPAGTRMDVSTALALIVGRMLKSILGPISWLAQWLSGQHQGQRAFFDPHRKAEDMTAPAINRTPQNNP
jgi:hypothetical protein